VKGGGNAISLRTFQLVGKNRGQKIREETLPRKEYPRPSRSGKHLSDCALRVKVGWRKTQKGVGGSEGDRIVKRKL